RADYADADENVYGMEAGDEIVQTEKELYRAHVRTGLLKVDTRDQMLLVLVVVFKYMHDQKARAQKRGGTHQNDSRATLIELDGPYGERNQTTANQQHRGLRGPQQHVGMPAGFCEAQRIEHPADRVTGEEHAEEKNLGREKHPHAQRCGLTLLDRIVVLLFDRNGFPTRRH